MDNILLKHSGTEELRKLFDDWSYISSRKNQINFPFVLPNYFLEINPEITVETVIDALTESLETNNLIDFVGPVHSYLYSLTYSDERDSSFDSFKNFYDVFTKNLSKYGETFRGVLAIDITEWVESAACNSKKFIAFLDFMSSIDDETLAVFISRSSNEAKNNEAFQIVLTKSRVRRIRIGEVKEEEGYQYVMELLAEVTMTVDEDATEDLKSIVSFILSVNGNEGLKSLHQFVDEIIYDKLVSKEENIVVLHKKDIANYLPTSTWASSFKNSRKKYLGLIGG